MQNFRVWRDFASKLKQTGLREASCCWIDSIPVLNYFSLVGMSDSELMLGAGDEEDEEGEGAEGNE